jgi:CheY-like chemotaxis protein
MLSSEMHRAGGPSDETNQPGVAPRRTILLVTGDHDLRAVVTRVLRREGYRVVAATHTGHALLAGLKDGPIDILATELSMDEMSGPALADRLRRLHPELRTLYFANPGSSECGGVLVRPFTRDDLIGRLRLLAPASPASLR